MLNVRDLGVNCWTIVDLFYDISVQTDIYIFIQDIQLALLSLSDKYALRLIIEK